MSDPGIVSPPQVGLNLKYYSILLLIVVGHALSTLFNLQLFMIALGLVVVGYIPGTLSIRILFRQANILRKSERQVLSVVLSILLVTSLGLLLNLFPQGLRPNIIYISVWFLILLLLTINLLFDKYRPITVRSTQTIASPLSNWAPDNLSKRSLLSHFAVIVVAVLSLTVFVHLTLSAEVDERYTEFFVLGDSGKADPSSFMLHVGKLQVVVFGVSNHQGDEQQYYFEATSVNNLLFRSDLFLINDDETIYMPVELQPPGVSSGERIEVKLFNSDYGHPLSTLLFQVAE